jgi:hypothetical protein
VKKLDGASTIQFDGKAITLCGKDNSKNFYRNALLSQTHWLFQTG